MKKHAIGWLVVALMFSSLCVAQTEDKEMRWFSIDSLNVGLDAPPEAVKRQTPRESVRSFFELTKQEDFEAALRESVGKECQNVPDDRVGASSECRHRVPEGEIQGVCRGRKNVIEHHKLSCFVTAQTEAVQKVSFYLMTSEPFAGWQAEMNVREKLLGFIRDNHPEWWPREVVVTSHHDIARGERPTARSVTRPATVSDRPDAGD